MWWLWLQEIITASVSEHSLGTAYNEQFNIKMWHIFNYSVTLLSDQPVTLETVKELALWYFLSRGNTLFIFPCCEHVLPVSLTQSRQKWSVWTHGGIVFWCCCLTLWTGLRSCWIWWKSPFCLVSSRPSILHRYRWLQHVDRPCTHWIAANRCILFTLRAFFLPGSPPVSCWRALEEISSETCVLTIS